MPVHTQATDVIDIDGICESGELTINGHWKSWKPRGRSCNYGA